MAGKTPKNAAFLLTSIVAAALMVPFGFVTIAKAGPGELGGANCEGSLVRVGLKAFMEVEYSLIVSPHEGYVQDSRNGDEGLFLFDEAPFTTLDGTSSTIRYLMSGYTDNPHDYCEPILCTAMDDISERFGNLGANEDPDPLIQEALNTIGTPCVLSPMRPVPTSGP
jgi:hypothetical protein